MVMDIVSDTLSERAFASVYADNVAIFDMVRVKLTKWKDAFIRRGLRLHKGGPEYVRFLFNRKRTMSLRTRAPLWSI